MVCHKPLDCLGEAQPADSDSSLPRNRSFFQRLCGRPFTTVTASERNTVKDLKKRASKSFSCPNYSGQAMVELKSDVAGNPERERDSSEDCRDETSNLSGVNRNPLNEAATSLRDDAAASELPDSRYLSEYTVMKILGQGSNGKVCLCKNTVSGAVYALKQLRKAKSTGLRKRWSGNSSDELRMRLDPSQGEAMACALPSHPHVLRVLEVLHLSDGSAMVVMEAALGGDLGGAGFRSSGDLDERSLASAFWQVLQGVAHLHRLGFVHGDLKPGNMLLGGDDSTTVKVADLGCANRFTSPDASTWLVSNTPSGTPAYLAPEQTTAEPYLGPPADVWALGVCLFHLATGRLPFQGESILGLYRAIASGPLPNELQRGGGLPDLLADLLAGMLQRDAARRLTLSEVMSHPWFEARHARSAGIREGQTGDCAEASPRPDTLAGHL